MKTTGKHIIAVVTAALMFAAGAEGVEIQKEADMSGKGLVFTTPQNDGILNTYMVAVYEALGKRLGFPCTIVALPKKRCLTDADRGLYDGVAARIIGLEEMGYKNLIRVKVSHYTAQHIVFARAEAVPDTVKDMESLLNTARDRPFVIGYLQGSQKAEQLLAGLPEKSKVALDLPEQAFRMLVNGRIDAYLGGPGIENRAVLKNLKERASSGEGLQAVKALFIAAEFPLFPYLHVKHEKLLPAFEATLRAMTADGTLDQILKSVQ